MSVWNSVPVLAGMNPNMLPEVSKKTFILDGKREDFSLFKFVSMGHPFEVKPGGVEVQLQLMVTENVANRHNLIRCLIIGSFKSVIIVQDNKAN
jgi:hypothetical protein